MLPGNEPQPNKTLTKFFPHDAQFVNEVIPAFCRSDLRLVGCGTGRRPGNLLTVVPSKEGPWKGLIQIGA